jgi:hypothetical protein
MNIVRNGVILAVYTFSVVIAYIVLSEPAAQMINTIAAAGADVPTMSSIVAEVKAVLSICFALAVIIPSVLFIWMAYTDMEIIY